MDDISYLISIVPYEGIKTRKLDLKKWIKTNGYSGVFDLS